ncbi:hypothetical protein BDW67DRAFT_181862 [Aspergillus spinulosporus]
MHFSSPLLALVPSLSLAFAAPTAENIDSTPLLPHGLPHPSPEQLQQIEQAAHGTLPGLPLPTNVSTTGITNLQLLAFQEHVEVAFFDQLVGNITRNVPGYEFVNYTEREFALRSLMTTLAQEEVHALTANNALQHFGIPTIEPCRYWFPVSNIDEAIALATTFTSHSLATLQDITERFATHGDAALARIMTGIIGTKGAQQGWFRTFQDKYPSEVPTLTTSNVDFAFTWANNFALPGTCPNLGDIKLRIFEPLEIMTDPEPRTHKIQVSWSHGPDESKENLLWIAYINQQNVPVVAPLQVVACDGYKSTADVVVPFDDFLMNGLTVMAVVNRRGPFANAEAVARATVYGPALFIVQ